MCGNTVSSIVIPAKAGQTGRSWFGRQRRTQFARHGRLASIQLFYLLPYRSGSSRGFTLLEVLIALVIFALCAAVFIRHNEQSLATETQLELKSRGLWLAENKLTDIRLLKTWPEPGTQTDRQQEAGLSWHIETEITETLDEDLRKVEVSVAREDSPDYTIARLTGFVGRY